MSARDELERLYGYIFSKRLVPTHESDAALVDQIIGAWDRLAEDVERDVRKSLGDQIDDAVSDLEFAASHLKRGRL